MSGADYFRLIFYEAPLLHSQANPGKPFQVFDQLFRQGFSAINVAVQKDLKPDGISLSPSVVTSLSHSLRLRLKQLLGPIFQANYEDIISQAVASGVLPAKRTAAQELEVRQWFAATMQQAGTARLFASHPYLEKTAVQIINDWVDDTGNFLQRLAQDLNDIYPSSDKPGVDRTIRKLRCDLSDAHRGGQTVKIIELTDSTFVYKPRSLACEANFYRLLRELNQSGLKPNFYTPWVINKGSYGWMEYCQPLTNTSQGLPPKRYAQQCGALCALWYLVGGTDLHYDNLLFTDKGVVIVDCETIFEADLYHYNRPHQQIEPDDITHSLLGTHALSHLLADPREGGKLRDVGGLAQYKALPGSHLDWEAFVGAVCQSIAATLRFFRRMSPKDAAKVIQKHFAADVPCRVILRGTRGYAALLHNLSNTFDALQTAESATDYLTRQLDRLPMLHKESIDKEIIKQTEIPQLLRFDIPYFGRILGRNQFPAAGHNQGPAKHFDFSALHQRLQWLQGPQFISSQTGLVRRTLLEQSQPAQHSPKDRRHTPVRLRPVQKH